MTNAIDQVLVELIKSFPTLRASRLDALYAIASSSDCKWSPEGDVVIDPSMNYRDKPVCAPEDDHDLVRYRAKMETGDKFATEQYADRLMWLREYQNKSDFIRENAEVIVAAGNSYKHGFVEAAPSGPLSFLEKDVPENANPEWVKALTELAEEIGYYREPEGKYQNMTVEARNAALKRIEECKLRAKTFLIRVKGSDTEKMTLLRQQFEARLASLAKEAERAGVVITSTVV